MTSSEWVITKQSVTSVSMIFLKSISIMSLINALEIRYELWYGVIFTLFLVQKQN